MSVRQQIDDIKNRLLAQNDLQADEASEALIQLSALLGNVIQEIKNRNDAYYKKYLEVIEQPKMSVAKADIIMKNTTEWSELETARGYEKFTIEMIRSLKLYIRNKGSEFESSVNL